MTITALVLVMVVPLLLDSTAAHRQHKLHQIQTIEEQITLTPKHNYHHVVTSDDEKPAAKRRHQMHSSDDQTIAEKSNQKHHHLQISDVKPTAIESGHKHHRPQTSTERPTTITVPKHKHHHSSTHEEEKTNAKPVGKHHQGQTSPEKPTNTMPEHKHHHISTTEEERTRAKKVHKHHHLRTSDGKPIATEPEHKYHSHIHASSEEKIKGAEYSDKYDKYPSKYQDKPPDEYNNTPPRSCSQCPDCVCPPCLFKPCYPCLPCPSCVCPTCKYEPCVCRPCEPCQACRCSPSCKPSNMTCSPCPHCTCPGCPPPVCPLSLPCSKIPPRDCADIYSAGERSSGVYTIAVGSTVKPLKVFCDMLTDGGGWTVFHRRFDGSCDFHRRWNDYALGFGDLGAEFWLGNDNLHSITARRRYHLRVDIGDWAGHRAYAEYSNFKMASRCDNYLLESLGDYAGTAGNSLSWHVGQRWCTQDQDNKFGCSVASYGAWWYLDQPVCHYANLCGMYFTSGLTTSMTSHCWLYYNMNFYSLQMSEMKVRPDTSSISDF